MNLTEYNELCARMSAYCDRAYSQEDIKGNICPRVSACDVQTLEGYELELIKAYEGKFEGIRDGLDGLNNNSTINRYRQNFTVYDSIQALIDDIKANNVYCPQKAQKRLIGSLERLYQMFGSISQMCFAEFDKMKPKGRKPKKKTPLKKLDIVSNPKALNYCFSEKGYLDDNFKIKRDVTDNAKMTEIAYNLKAILGRSLKDIGAYWGVNAKVFVNRNYQNNRG